MQRVLLDGTTLISASRLLEGKVRPTALNLWSLSLLVECLILHEELIVLDTLEDDQRLQIAARDFGNPVRIERYKVSELVNRYIEMEFPELSGLPTLSDEQLRRSYNDINEAQRHLKYILEHSYSEDDGMASYLDMLEEVHTRELTEKRKKKQRFERSMRRLLPSIANAWYAFSDQSRPPAPPYDDGTAIGTIAGNSDICHAWERFMERYTNVASTSPWYDGEEVRASYRHKFTPALLIRTHLYLVASEVLNAPYRPDIFRAPICWKFFDLGSFKQYQYTMEDSFVDAAERAGRERVEFVTSAYRRPAFASLPLFLARVLARSGKPSDIVPEALRIRASKEAIRFREQLAQLSTAEDSGDFEAIYREMSRYSLMLREAYGTTQRAEVVLSLGASAAKELFRPSPAATIDLGSAAIAASGLVRSWWYRRKMALIAKSIHVAKRADTMQPQLHRLFGAELNSGEIAFINRASGDFPPAPSKAE